MDIVLLLPVDPVGPRALPVQGERVREGHKKIHVRVKDHSDARKRTEIFFFKYEDGNVILKKSD